MEPQISEPLVAPRSHEVRLENPRLVTAWLALGVCALAVAGIFAILLVLARTPKIQDFFPWVDFFRTALVVHVDQSVLIWFLAFAGALWGLGPAPRGWRNRIAWLGFLVAAVGAALVAVAPFAGAGDPLMNNYVPVLRHPLFFAGLVCFLGGVLVPALLRALAGGRLGRPPGMVGVLDLAAWSAAVATLVAVLSLVWSYLEVPSSLQGEAYFEYLFWGGGHTLQFAYTQLMLVAWLWLAAANGVELPVGPRALAGLVLLGVAPVLLVPLIHVVYPVFSPESRLAFTRLMQYGGGLAGVPLGLALVYGMARGAPGRTGQLPVRRALWTSLLMFAVGGLIGALISGVNTVIPAHYHGSIVGVTLALMGLTYHLLPQLGFAPVGGAMARLQPLLYAGGQLLHVSGLAVSGALGIQRKTAGAAQGLTELPTIAAMGVMGLGGLLAVVGGILFVLVVARSVLSGRR